MAKIEDLIARIPDDHIPDDRLREAAVVGKLSL